jgi:hypothetical protein
LLYDVDRPPHTSVLNIIFVLSFHRILGLRSGLQCWAYLLQFCTCEFKSSKSEAICDDLLVFVFEFVTTQPFLKMSDHSKSAVRDCFFDRRFSVSRGCLFCSKKGLSFIDSTLNKYLVKESEISNSRYPSPRHAPKLLPFTCHPHDLSRSIVIHRSNNFPFSFLSWS